VVSDISETLREQQGHHEVAEQERGEDESRVVLERHSRSTPLRISAMAAKNATVTITNTRSAIRDSSRQVVRSTT
jgi:hypothetical protein